MIYVELDCLLDTRLGTVKRISEQAGANLLKEGKYYDRTHDELWRLTNIDERLFKEVYHSRDHSVLKESRNTLVYKLINGALDEQKDKFLRNIADDSGAVTVNVYPFELTNSFREAIELCVANLLIYPTVEVIREDPKDLPPKRLSNSFEHAFIYDFEEYMGWHYRDIHNNPGLPVVLHFPALGRGENPHLADYETIMNGLASISEGLMGYLNISFEPVWNYSFHLHTTSEKFDSGFKQQTREEEELEVRLSQL